MLKVLLKVLLLPPGLLQSHVQGYADLISRICAQQLETLAKRCVLYALAALSLLLALVFGGMALLLWGALPLGNAPYAWVLPVLPLGLVVFAGLCWLKANSMRARQGLATIKEQIRMDMEMLRQAKES